MLSDERIDEIHPMVKDFPTWKREFARSIEQEVLAQKPPIDLAAIHKRMMAERFAQKPSAEPCAWKYELAESINREGAYCNWQWRCSDEKPNVPDASIRNLQPLFTHATDSASEVESLKLERDEWMESTFSSRQFYRDAKYQLDAKYAEIARLTEQSANRLIGLCKCGEEREALTQRVAELEASENMPVTYLQIDGIGPMYAIYGTSSISCIEALQAKVTKLTDALGAAIRSFGDIANHAHKSEWVRDWANEAIAEIKEAKGGV